MRKCNTEATMLKALRAFTGALKAVSCENYSIVAERLVMKSKIIRDKMFKAIITCSIDSGISIPLIRQLYLLGNFSSNCNSGLKVERTFLRSFFMKRSLNIFALMLKRIFLTLYVCSCFMSLLL